MIPTLGFYAKPYSNVFQIFSLSQLEFFMFPQNSSGHLTQLSSVYSTFINAFNNQQIVSLEWSDNKLCFSKGPLDGRSQLVIDNYSLLV